ncbi:MAG: flagellar export protein FliJ [Gammaproteobacteria bacterium]|nr:flagellar export protein FliJ [Gammaproteobacteria bacterium]
MKKSNRIIPLKQLASRHEQQAARTLGESKKTLSDHQQRLDDLNAYRREYQNRFQTEGLMGMNGSKLQAYQNFIAQLDQAIEQQKIQLVEAQQSCINETRQWQERHIKTEVFTKTVERFENQEKIMREKKSQREIDDYVNARLHTTIK